jgi:pimeloyl-ACP methyl ester carboxylesterase
MWANFFNRYSRTLNRTGLRALLSGLTLLLASCLPTKDPIPSVNFIAENSDGRNLMIMLPGRGDRMDVFGAHQFPQIANQHGFDVVAVDAHFSYYRKRILLPRLNADIVKPARAAGYENIWLLGVSLGGFGSLLYAEEFPQDIDGVILFAPFLGEPDIATDIEQAGGLSSWVPDDSGKYKPYEIDVWKWIKQETGKADGTPVYLGYGDSDHLAVSYGPLLQVLHDTHVHAIRGGHDWTTWKKIWPALATTVSSSEP